MILGVESTIEVRLRRVMYSYEALRKKRWDVLKISLILPLVYFYCMCVFNSLCVFPMHVIGSFLFGYGLWALDTIISNVTNILLEPCLCNHMYISVLNVYINH